MKHITQTKQTNADFQKSKFINKLTNRFRSRFNPRYADSYGNNHGSNHILRHVNFCSPDTLTSIPPSKELDCKANLRFHSSMSDIKKITNSAKLPYKVSVLVFIKNKKDQFLLLKRKKSPNLGCWTPIGGKVHMDDGESPFDCAIRETLEEANFLITNKDLHLFSMIAEKSYENSNHWLLFLFNCTKPIDHLPDPIKEGHFDFYSREEVDKLELPQTDREGLWDIYDKYNTRFIALKADCHPDKKLHIIVEECH